MENKDPQSKNEFFKTIAQKPLLLSYGLLLFSALLLSTCTKNLENNIIVTTNDVTDITENSAKCGGSVSGSGYAVGDCGVCYGKYHNPILNDSTSGGYFTIDNEGTGSFNSTLNNLKSGTTYYVRAYAKTSSGIEYGDEKSFTTKYGYGSFSVSPNTKVRFSPGNLQYQASTNTWRFAENQWDYVGSQDPSIGLGGTIYFSDNSFISPTYDGWIDLFGWGTSGYNHGALCYHPYSTSENQSDYYAYGSSSYNLFDQTGKADWGYNPISNGGNTENTWRTLTRDEWVYVFNTRTTSSGIRYAGATVNGVVGIILVPDQWSNNYYNLSDTNSSQYISNTVTATTWANNLEAHGAVFLPAAGYRTGTDCTGTGTGWYWSSSINNDVNYNFYSVKSVKFGGGKVSPSFFDSPESGHSVRLVYPVE